MISKIIKFVKENKIVVFSLAVIVLSFILFALPGQFAHYELVGKKFNYNLSGYQWIFNTMVKKGNGITAKVGNSVVGQGIAVIVMLAIAIPGLIFSRKSSFVTLVTGLDLLVTSILLFTISNAGLKAYPYAQLVGHSLMNWVPYVVGALVVIAAGLVIYKAVMMMKDEIKHPVQPKGPTYNYLHK